MIVLTRHNDTQFALNDDLIETIEECPDTTIKLTNGKIYIVAESLSEIIDKIIEQRQQCISNVYYGANVSQTAKR